MSKVFILNHDKQPLTPCHAAKARKLLREGKASVFRRYPFTVILKEQVENPTVQPMRVKIDPGSKTTGIAIVNDENGEVIFAAELEHRGHAVKASMDSRRASRRGRRSRKTLYRKPRFLNRKSKRELPPSLESRVSNTITWIERLCRYCPISAISMELVKFDTQAMQNPEIAGVAYQQGTLAGYECREYLLEKFNRTCAYCKKKDVPLQIEHIVPKSRGGTNRISNLTIACQSCNQKKGNMTADEFGFPEVQAQAKKPLKDAATVNVTRWVLFNRLKAFGLPLETGTGGRTKFNRIQRGLPKAHFIDAACVGASTPEIIKLESVRPLSIKAVGYGSRQMCRTDRFGFPVAIKTRNKTFLGFKTGDFVKAVIPNGKYAGDYTGRVTIRQRPSFTVNGVDCHPKYMTLFQRADGYSYPPPR
ncbi:MAG: RNA-guided endonuclease IscB [Blastocatellia bacterium]|nr:RNA-guided endonuclease IscB [Blastocatellia bacterium]